VTQEGIASGLEKARAGGESARSMAVTVRAAVLALSLISFIGAILHSFFSSIPYTPVFAIIVLVNSLICLAAGTRASWMSRDFQQAADVVGGLAYSAIVGGVLMIMWSVGAAISAVVGGTGGVAGPHGSALLLNLSWPATVISLVAIGFGIGANRRMKKLASSV
jgi:hypothetical protein